MAGPWEDFAKPAAADGPWSDFAKLKVSPKPDTYDPTEGMSTLEKGMAGAGKAAVDLYRGVKQITGIGDQAELQAEIDQSKKLDAPLMATGAGTVGNIAGSVAMTALPGSWAARGAAMVPGALRVAQAAQAAHPLLSAMAPGVASGAALGALDPVATGDSRAANAGLGAAAGGLGGAVARGASKVLGGKAASAADDLLKDEVRLTPGQALGGMAQRLEDGATSIPVIGDMVKKSQRRAVEDFNRAAYNRVLEPIGEKLAKGEPVSRATLGAVETKLGDAYDRVLTKIGRVDLDDTFKAEVGKVASMVQELPDTMQGQFKAILKTKIADKMTPAGTMSADTMKVAESELGRLARGLGSSDDFEKRQLGDAIREVQQSLRGAVERSAPEHAAELKSVNEAFAKFVRVQRAAARVTSEDGVFSPAALLEATKAGDKSVRKGAFARGDALMQDFAENAKGVLGAKVPDSGTALRLMAGMGALGGAGAYFDVTPGQAAGMAALALPYSRAGRAATLAAIAKRPDVARQLATVFERGAPAAGVAGAYMGLPSFAGP